MQPMLKHALQEHGIDCRFRKGENAPNVSDARIGITPTNVLLAGRWVSGPLLGWTMECMW